MRISRNVVGAGMIACYFTMTIGPNTNPPTGTLAFIENQFSINHNVFAYSFLICGSIILLAKPYGLRYQLLTIPLVFYIVFSNSYVIHEGLNWTSFVLLWLLYIFVIRSQKGDKT